MSNESQSQSGSSNSSGQLTIFQDNIIDLGNSATNFTRSGTVVRRASKPFRKDTIESTSSTEDDETTPREKYRREPQYRHSLVAISERKSRKNSLSNDSGKSFHRIANSLDSSESPDYVRETLNENRGEKQEQSPSSSSYLSWIESVNSEYFGSAISNAPSQDAETKVGEWNNFWLNYSNARLRHLSTEQTFSSEGANESDEERKSSASTQKDVTDKTSMEYVMLTMEEMQETVRCSQRIVDILQNAMKRSEIDATSNESYYSQTISGKNSILEDIPSTRERSISCGENLQRPKQAPFQQQSSSTSCIEAILNTGVADIVKKVISKRREVVTSTRSITRSPFSEWTGR